MVGLDFFGNGVTKASFQAAGKLPVIRQKLNMWKRIGIISSRIGRIISRLMPSLPTALQLIENKLYHNQ